MTEDTKKQVKNKTDDDLYKFRFSYFFIFMDFCLRWAVFGARRFGLINDLVFWVIQGVIPILILYLADKRSNQVQSKYKIKKVGKIVPQDTTRSITFGLLVLGLGTYISYSLYPTWSAWLRVPFAIMTFLFYGTYLMAVYVNSVQIKFLEGPAGTEDPLTDDEWRDENDRVIVKLETDKTSLAQRVDAYTLESALFGALSFSGFVTIISSEKPVLSGVQMLISDISKLFGMILRFEFVELSQIWRDVTLDNTLIAAIAIQTLVCSIFFLSVIISRIRFNDILKRVDYSTRLACAYNHKEEEIHYLTLQDNAKATRDAQETRLQDLKRKISQSIFYAEESMTHLVPIVTYMSVFRNLGIICFILILITSALWVSSLLAIFFTVSSVVAYVFPFFDRWLRDRKLSNIVFFQRGRKFFPHLTRK